MPRMAGPGQLQRLLDAVMAIGSELELSALLQRVLEAAKDLAGARYGAVGVLDDTGTRLAEFITAGLTDEERAAIGALPEGHGILGLLIVDAKPLRLPHLGEHPDSYGFPPNHPPMTSFLGVPIQVRGQAFGNLYLTDKEEGEVFTDVDEELVVALAGAAGIAIENTRLQARLAELAMLEDRERIARDLHDTVIQRLFATGLTLQAAMRLAVPPGGSLERRGGQLADKLSTAIDDVDTTIREIRSVIFELHATRLPGRSARQAVLDVCNEAARALGFDPIVRFDGPIDASLPDSAIDHVAAAVQEALSNVARHAGATRCEVSLSAADDWLRVLVKDNGTGIPDDTTSGGRGLGNLRARAERLGGTCSVERRDEGGTAVEWSVPLKQAGA